jgi:hypothetical protein
MERNLKTDGRFEYNIVSPPRVIVKFKKGKAPPYQSQIEGYESLGDYIQKKKIGPWVSLSKKFPGISVQLIFVRVSPEAIQNLVRKASELDPSYEDPNFLRYFAVAFDEIPEGASYEELYRNMKQIAEELSSWKSVEHADVTHGLGPLPMAPGTQNTGMAIQTYLDPATQGGIDAKYAWDYWDLQGYADGAGANINFIDIQRGWDLDHQDLVSPAISLIQPGYNKQDQWHGTATLGVVLGRDGTAGIVGIAYEANARVVSVYPNNASTNPDLHDSIMLALNNLTSGDVLLIEEQAIGNLFTINYTAPGTNVNTSIDCRELWPVETAPDPTTPNSLIWEVINLGTTSEIIIIEPAGNGYTPEKPTDSIPPGTPGNNLANFTAGGMHLLDRDPASAHYVEFKDSQAIIVGAASSGVPTDSYKHYRTVQSISRLPSNHGKRIDCFGWGEWVWTSGGGPDVNPTHTAYLNFNGTSSAAAMIAGVALAIQSVAAKRGSRLKPLEMRSILSNPLYGTPVYAPGAAVIVEGYLPDLKKILDNYFNTPP